MGGIDRIISSIREKAEAEASSIVSDAEKTAGELIEKTKNECAIFSEEENSKSDKKIKLAKARFVSEGEQAARLIILNARQEAIEDAIAAARKSLLESLDKDYFDTLLKLIVKAANKGEGELILSAKDKSRLPADFMSRVTEAVSGRGGKLLMSENTADIDGGFILRYGQIEENYSFEALFDENHDRLQDAVHSILWN